MFHPDTRRAIELWTALAEQSGGVPPRVALRPEAFGPRLARVSLMEGAGDRTVFRIVGEQIEALHGRELRGAPATQLFTGPSASLWTTARLRASDEGRSVIIRGRSDREANEVELTLAPLRGRGGRVDLLLGVLAWSGRPASLRTGVRRLEALEVVAVDRPRRPHLELASLHGRRIA